MKKLSQSGELNEDTMLSIIIFHNILRNTIVRYRLILRDTRQARRVFTSYFLRLLLKAD